MWFQGGSTTCPGLAQLKVRSTWFTNCRGLVRQRLSTRHKGVATP
jgi:hypothetical protein